ncbi:MAG: hypothetical protein JWM75_1057 [Sphingomonas bacterium]|nr:hypothetical protein [Sphingomonas bacterium]
MSFILRQVSRSAEGREIVRTRTIVETGIETEIEIGRDPNCEIHLADLAVTLHHARIRRLSPGRIEIVATANLPFDVDGRSTERAEIEVARGASIRMGAHSLAISAGEQAGDVAITIERVEALSDASQARDEGRLFSLRGVAPGKRASAWVFALLVLVAALGWPLWSFYSYHDENMAQALAATRSPAALRPAGFHADEMWSSGKLSRAHANLEGNCQACHVKPFESVRDDTCTACHAKVHDHADPRRLAAARPEPAPGAKFQLAVANAFNKPEGGCVECHTEHEGAGTMPATAQRFCSDCHGALDQKLRDTKLQNAGDFGTSHPEFRPAIVTNPTGPKPILQRVSLAATPAEESGLKFPHALHLSKTNGVARMAQTMAAEQNFGNGLDCKDCHIPDSGGTRFQQVDMEKDCAMCHSLAFDRIQGTVRTLRHGDPKAVVADLRAFYRSTAPSRPISLGGMARRRPGDFAAYRTAQDYRLGATSRPGGADGAIRAVFSPGGACFDCHQVVQPSQTKTGTYGVVPVHLPDRYMMKGWFDHAAHDTETCVSCHAAKTSTKSADLLLPNIASCRTCHGGESAHKEVPSSCAMCHDYHVTGGAPASIRQDRKRSDPGARRDNVVAAAF